MTARLPEEPVRVTSWLAGWVDYMFAIVLVVGRWLRLPVSRTSEEPVMLSAFAPAMADQYAPRWNDPGQKQQSGLLVRAAEIVMLSISFFLAAHLLSGGTATVSAPDLNLGLLSDHASAETLAVPATSARQVTVPAGSFVSQTAAQSKDASPEATVEAIAVLAEPTAADAGSAGIAGTATNPADAPAAVVEETAPAAPAAPAEAPVPAHAAEATPAPAPAPVAPTVPDRYLTVAEIHAAALAAGWPAALVPDVEKVAWCESRYHTHAEYLGARGLMQMLSFWFTEEEMANGMWADPVTNLRAAYFAYREHERITGDPWSAWTCKP